MVVGPSAEPEARLHSSPRRPPEQVAGQQLDVRSNIFSLGGCLYALSTGAKTFTGTSVMEVLRRITRGQLPDLQELDDTVRAIIGGDVL